MTSTPNNSPTADECIRCPECEYNLTGIASGCCPECGNAFDRDELLARAKDRPAPVPIWDEREQIGAITAYLRVTFNVMFSPGAFGRMLPPNPDWTPARRFGWCSNSIAAVVVLIGLLVASMHLSLGPLLGYVMTTVTWLLGAVVCENLIAVGICMRQVATGHTELFTRARTMTCLGSCFLIGSALSITVDLAYDSGIDAFPRNGLIGALLLTLWWWASISLMVWRASGSGLHALLMLFVVPFAVILSGVLSTIVVWASIFLLVGVGQIL